MEKIKIDNRYNYNHQRNSSPLNSLFEAILKKEDIWFQFNNGARAGSIAKVVDCSNWSTSGGSTNITLPRSFQVEVSEGKTIKVGVKSYRNNFTFIVGYTGTYVIEYERGRAKDKPKETTHPDMLGNNIKLGDWVIFTTKGRGGKPGLGKLNRLSEAGNAWVMTPNRHGDEVEVMTEGASCLIKVNMTPELLTTYVLCDSLQGLRTKLIIDLDLD